jgi:hypothetical protein
MVFIGTSLPVLPFLSSSDPPPSVAWWRARRLGLIGSAGTSAGVLCGLIYVLSCRRFIVWPVTCLQEEINLMKKIAFQLIWTWLLYRLSDMTEEALQTVKYNFSRRKNCESCNSPEHWAIWRRQNIYWNAKAERTDSGRISTGMRKPNELTQAEYLLECEGRANWLRQNICWNARAERTDSGRISTGMRGPSELTQAEYLLECEGRTNWLRQNIYWNARAERTDSGRKSTKMRDVPRSNPS